MFEGFDEFTVQTAQDVHIYGRKGGQGPPLLLVHGYPQNHRIWHLVAPQLMNSYTLVMPDVRGYGRSSHPPCLVDHSNYSKRTTARDLVQVMQHFGFAQFFLCGHDCGARVAHQMAVDHPRAVQRVMILDLAPALALFDAMDATAGTLIAAAPAAFYERVTAFGGIEFDHEAAKRSLDSLADYDTCSAMCEDYRAAYTVDRDNAREDIRAGRFVQCPLRCLWGTKGSTHGQVDTLGLWRQVCTGPVDGEETQSGHFITEEVPDLTAMHMKEFFRT